jgi:molybdopterin/thiamine biosynthesis adenylyltransferase
MTSGDRYIRQIPVIGKDGQERLASATVLIAGAGGLGSPAAMYLAAAGIGKIVIIDFDRVEESNLNRQILHWANDIGAKKTDSAREKLEALNPSITVSAVCERIDEKNARNFVKEADVVIDALDNFKTRLLLNTAAFEEDIPFIHGAIRGFHGQATTMLSGQTACLQCLYGPAPPVEEHTPVLGVTAGIIAMVQAGEAIKYLAGTGDLLANRLFIWDGLSSRADEIAIAPAPSCPLCRLSSRSSIKEEP